MVKAPEEAPQPVSDKQQPQLPSPDVVRDLVRVGVEQIKIRKQELELQEKESHRQYEFAKQALAAQAEDRRDARKYRRKRTVDRYIFVAVLFAFGVLFILALSYMGKDELAKEISKLTATFLAGGLSGYGLSKARARRAANVDEEVELTPNA
jgi:VIT1/CCC1 family predicted Fe2+/Mn2+ transporter